MQKFKIRRGDTVIITTGKDKGKQGKVLTVIPDKDKIIVSGINLVKKHSKPTKSSEGGIITKELPINISNAAHIDPKSGCATKVGFKFLEDGTKVIISKKSGEIIPREGK